MEYSFSGKLKITTFIMMAIGIVAMIVGFMTDDSAHQTRFWANFLVNGFFFMGISLGALFFIAFQFAAEVAWSVAVKRVFEAVMGFVPVGSVILIVVFLAGTFHLHHLYHWMDPDVYDVNSEHYDAVIAGKSAYLNQPFFWIRTLVYLATFFLFARYFRKTSLEQDTIGGSAIHSKTIGKSAIFLVMFAVFSSTSSWDWLMSIDVHWFSTLYGWYVFSGMWVTGLIVTLILIVWLKNKGLLPQVNDSHIHDVAKWMFAISFLWSYLWFSQFMLIWYANIPEEVIYFITRIEHYPLMFFGMFFVNLLFPMVILMSRDAKRNVIFFLPVALIIFVGHYFDVYCLIVPGTMGEHWHFGMMEIGMFIGFLGLFVFSVLTNLSKAPLMVQQHPFLDESIHHNL